MRLTWSQALSWRLHRHHLAPAGARSVDDVVRRLGAVPAWSGDPEVAVGMRRSAHVPGDVAEALADGRLIKVFAFGGGTFLMVPDDAGIFLALRAASRMWERPAWREHYGLAPDDWPRLREAVRDALADGPLTPTAMAAAVTRAHPRFRQAFDNLSETLLKPLTWQGDMCFGPTVDGEATFQALAQNPRWAGVPELDDAGRRAVVAYLSTYGPATPDHLHYYLGEGLGAGRKRIVGWLTDLADRLAEVEIDGSAALIPAEYVDELAATEPTGAIHLVAGHDPWIRGAGTKDTHVVPPTHRPLATRGANAVLVGGVLAGSWKISGSDLVVHWLAETAPPTASDLAEQTGRLASVLDRDLRVLVERG